MTSSTQFSLPHIYQTISNHAKHCKIDLQFALELCFVKKTEPNKVSTHIVVDAYVPLNSELKTNISYAQPLLCFPLGLQFSVDDLRNFSINNLGCLAESLGKTSAEMLHYCGDHPDFNIKKGFSLLQKSADFHQAVLSSLTTQVSSHFLDYCIDMIKA